MTLETPEENRSVPRDRIVSVDALRGFDMLWILGAGEVVHQLYKVHPWPWLAPVNAQLEHTEWSGFTLYDLIFPLFLFIVGTTTVFSLSRFRDEKGPAIRRVLFRFVCLFLLGIIYNGGMRHAWPDVRLLGVLQRIAICYLVTSFLFLYFRPRTLVIVAVTLLLLYWGLMKYVPVPGFARGDYAEGHNLANYIDKIVLPGRKYNGDHDPEGLLSTIPSIVTCLLGLFSGQLLRSTRSGLAKVAMLVIGGAVIVIIGMVWGNMLRGVNTPAELVFPVNKKLWTSSFVLVAGGASAALLGLFYLVIDVWRLRGWALPFVWIGMNAITLYVVEMVFDFHAVADRLVGGSIARAVAPNEDLVKSIVVLALLWLLARFLYRRSIFIRV